MSTATEEVTCKAFLQAGMPVDSSRPAAEVARRFDRLSQHLTCQLTRALQQPDSYAEAEDSVPDVQKYMPSDGGRA
jgi:hypothetical protein